LIFAFCLLTFFLLLTSDLFVTPHSGQKGVEERGLADPRLARHEHHLVHSLKRFV
jgi:hypothetical protein